MMEKQTKLNYIPPLLNPKATFVPRDEGPGQWIALIGMLLDPLDTHCLVYAGIHNYERGKDHW